MSYCLNFWYNDQNIEASNNFFNTINVGNIDLIIYDRNDVTGGNADYVGYVIYLPIEDNFIQEAGIQGD